VSNVISVSQFNNYVHNIFDAEEILHNISIFGEVSATSMSGGNLYFSIKDEGAVLSCVRFGARSGFVPKEGEQVLVVGSPNYYVKGGRFSFNVVRIEPYGQGLLYQKFLEMKNKLASLGMFDADKKKPLPQVIRRIGVVSSETGAVIQDIIDIAGRRNPMLDIVLYPAKVQGIGAESTIIDGLRALDKTNVDVIIIARGGGSAELSFGALFKPYFANCASGVSVWAMLIWRILTYYGYLLQGILVILYDYLFGNKKIAPLLQKYKDEDKQRAMSLYREIDRAEKAVKKNANRKKQKGE